jgi:hypothetical protein
MSIKNISTTTHHHQSEVSLTRILKKKQFSWRPTDRQMYALLCDARGRRVSPRPHGGRGRRRKDAARCRGAASEALTRGAVDAECECVDACEDATD